MSVSGPCIGDIALAFTPKNRPFPFQWAVTFVQVSSVAVHRHGQTRDVHWDLYNDKRVLSPFRGNDEDWKDAVGKHSRKFVAHFVDCRQGSQSNFSGTDVPNDERKNVILKVTDLKRRGL